MLRMVEEEDAARDAHPDRPLDQPPRLFDPHRFSRHRIGRERFNDGIRRRQQHQERRLGASIRGRDHLRGRHPRDRAVDEDQIGAVDECLTGRSDALACDDLDGRRCRRGRLPEHVMVALRRRQQNGS
jgi:hypothetical protein